MKKERFSKLPTKDETRPRAIIFFGSDGTGKTTQAGFVIDELQRRKLNVKRAWIRGRHLFAFLISQVLLKLGYSKTIIQTGAPGGKILDTRKLPGKRFWSLVEFSSVVPLALLRVYIPLLLGYSVVAERYIIDTAVYNSYFLGADFDAYVRILLSMIPKNSLLVHLDAKKEDVLARRKGDILSEDFIEYQLMQYRKIASRLNALSIDTSSNDMSSVREMIAKRL